MRPPIETAESREPHMEALYKSVQSMGVLATCFKPWPKSNHQQPRKSPSEINRQTRRNKITHPAFGDRLASLRTALKLNQSEFAQKLGIYQSNLSRYEKGLTKGNAKFFQRLIRFGVNTEWLLFGHGEMFGANKLNPARIHL